MHGGASGPEGVCRMRGDGAGPRGSHPPLHRSLAALQRVASLAKEGRLNLGWLEPPASMGAVTVLRALEAGGPAEYGEVARLWAESVWGAWSAHHETVRLWAAR